MASSDIKKNRGGRPAKFSEPSRPITVTLPERVLRLLAAVDPDRAKAITKVTEAALSTGGKPHKTVSTIQVAPGKSIILVDNSELLGRIPWLRLIEIAPARHLISIQSGTSIESMEVALHDLLEDLPKENSRDREVLEALRRILHASRRTRTTTKEEILFVAANG